jgi:hypothetical protein
MDEVSMVEVLKVWLVLLILPVGLVGMVEVFDKVMLKIDELREEARMQSLAKDYAEHFDPELAEGAFTESIPNTFRCAEKES